MDGSAASRNGGLICRDFGFRSVNQRYGIRVVTLCVYSQGNVATLRGKSTLQRACDRNTLGDTPIADGDEPRFPPRRMV